MTNSTRTVAKSQSCVRHTKHLVTLSGHWDKGPLPGPHRPLCEWEARPAHPPSRRPPFSLQDCT